LNSLQFVLKESFRPWTVWFPLKCIIWRKMLECFHPSNTFISFQLKKECHGHLGWVNYQQKFVFVFFSHKS